jgi:hypothetical protein
VKNEQIKIHSATVPRQDYVTVSFRAVKIRGASGALHRGPRSRGPRLESPDLYVKLVRDIRSRNLRTINKQLCTRGARYHCTALACLIGKIDQARSVAKLATLYCQLRAAGKGGEELP